MGNKLYTFFLTYKGGLYISQILAESPKCAVLKWSESLSIEEIVGLGVEFHKIVDAK
jgi:hypothetical protein